MPSHLLSPVRLGALELANRVVMAPMTRSRAGEARVPNSLMAEYYRQRAGAGLIVSEATQISPQGVGYINTPGIHRDDQVAGWKEVTDAVHAEGGRIVLQLWHVGRVSHPYFHGGALPVAPSAVAGEGQAYTPDGFQPLPTPRALETDEIAGIVEDFARATRLAREAGFDGVEIHGANGYLINQFLVTGANRRTDRYGGSVENRVRFLDEVTAAVVEAWSADRVGVRLSPRTTANGITDGDRVETFTHAARALDRYGLAYLHLIDPLAPGDVARPTADDLRGAFSGPIIVNGGYTKASAEKALADGVADAVAFGVPFISNPDLVQRFEMDAPLAPADRATFYAGGEKGYTTYPALAESEVA